MDAETKELIESLNKVLESKNKPFYYNIAQTVAAAAIIAIPTLIISIFVLVNKFENRLIESERVMKNEMISIRKDFERELGDIRKEAVSRETKLDFNFYLIARKHQEYDFYKLRETTR